MPKFSDYETSTFVGESSSSNNQQLKIYEGETGNDINQPELCNDWLANQKSSNENSSGGEGIRSALHGTIYQLKLSILFLQTALDKKYEFKLYSEKKDAEKFDDVIFKYERNNMYRFLQAKHKLNPAKDKITIGKLLSKDSKEPFNLQKYFVSFRRIKKKYKEKLKDLTICTNCDFSNDIKKEIDKGCGRLIFKDECDDILDIGGGKRYEFIFDENKDIVERLKDASNLNTLAVELAKVTFGKGKSLNLYNKSFKDYHVPLVNEVFDKKKLRVDGKTEWYCEFKETFAEGNNNLSEEAMLLREAFKKEVLKIDKSIDGKNLWNIASKKKLKVSASFGVHAKPKGEKLTQVTDEEVEEYLPNDPVTDDEIKEFFKILIVAVDQPNEEELGRLIQNKIFNSLDDLKDYVQAEVIYNYVQKQMLDWLKKPNSTALLKKDDFFSEGAKKVNEIMLSIPNREYTCLIKEKGINFNNKSKELQKLQEFFNSKKNKIFNFLSNEKNIFLSQAKVYQIKEQAAWQLKSLLNLEKFGNIKAENLFKDNLLIILCKNELQVEEEGITGLYDELVNCINENGNKVVLITEGDSILASFFKKGCFKNIYEECPDNTGVRDLDLNYLKNKLLKKTITFQGQEKNLIDLLGIHGRSNENGLSEENMLVLENVLNCEALSELIFNEELLLADKLPDFCDSNSPYYDPYYIDIPRDFKYKVINKDSLSRCLKNKEKHVFAFSATDEDCLNNLVPQEEKDKKKLFSEKSADKEFFTGRFFILGVDNPEEDFKELTTKKSGVDIHWITNIGKDKFILKRSNRVYALREFITEDSIKKNIKDLTDSVVIIAGDPGIGKSTVLTTCYQVLDKSSWFIRVNLKDHETHIENAKFQYLKGIVHFFAEVTVGLETALAKSLLKYRLKHQGQIVLLFDGYDEIKERNQEILIHLLKTLKENTKGKIWLTTRLSKQYELENSLGIFSHFLNPFDEKEQKNFLKRFWIKKLDVKKSSEKLRINNFAEKLLEHFRGLGLMKEENLVGIVLQARMVAEIFQDGCKNYLKFEKFNPSKFKINNIFDLYETFIDYQYVRYFSGKIKIDKELLGEGSKFVLTESYTKVHGCLALKALFFEDELCKEFLRNQTQIFLPDELSRLGLIRNFKNSDTVDFVHRTYAEYFIAKLVVSTLGKKGYESKIIREFLLRKIFLNTNKLISEFVTYGIQKQSNNYHLLKWEEIQNCDLLRNKKTQTILQLFNQPADNTSSNDISLSQLKEEVESCMNWNDGTYYYWNGDENLINTLFQKFFKETDINELKNSLNFLVNANGKSYFKLANRQFSKNNNINNAFEHYLFQAKKQNKLDQSFIYNLANIAVEDIKTFEHILIEFLRNKNEKYLERLVDFLCRSECEFNLLLIAYPSVAQLKQYIEPVYFNKDFYWLERNGILIAKCFKILTPKMSKYFCSVLDKPIKGFFITGFDIGYANNIFVGLIKPLIDMMKEDELFDVDKLSFIKMLTCFTHFFIELNKSLSFTFNQLDNLLKLIDNFLSEQIPVNFLSSVNYLFRLGKAGLKLIDTGQEILIIDPASEYLYSSSSSKYLRDHQIKQLIEWKWKNPNENFFKAYGNVMIQPQLRKRRASLDLQVFSKKR